MGSGESKEKKEEDRKLAMIDESTLTKEQKKQLLSAKDIKAASMYLVKKGGGKSGPEDGDSETVSAKDFERIFELKAKAAGMMDGNQTFEQLKENAVAKHGAEWVANMLDFDGDGQVDGKDFELMFQRYSNFLDNNSTTIDEYIPFLGQCAFGIGVGYCCGYAARSVYSYKVPIVIVSVAGYSALQYAAQQEFLNKEVLIAASKAKFKEVLDVNRDGDVNKKDVEAFVQDKFQIVATKLGPGGFAPGLAGGATFLFGLWRGMRPRRPK